MNKTKIEWCDYTWNPIVGCSAISPGCANCYAKRISKRFGYPWGKPAFRPERLGEPSRISKPCRIFVCSMSDIGHSGVRPEWLFNIVNAMAAAPHHTYILLTKRPANLMHYGFSSAWLGVTIESMDQAYRWRDVLEIPAAVHFVSVEPMLGPVRFGNYPWPDWVIAGPETGPKARPCVQEWIETLATESPCFFDKRKDGKRREFPIPALIAARRGEK